MALNPNIILAGQAPDIMGALATSNQAAQQRLEFDNQNALRAMMREQGPGIMAGDPNALNALAQFDPRLALGVQSDRLGMEQARQQMAFSAEEMQMRREEGKRLAAERLATESANMTAAQLAAEKDAITKGLSGAAFFYQKKDRAGYERFLAQSGMDPAEYPFDQFPAHAAMFEGVLEAFETFAPPEGPEWVAATPEQAAQYGSKGGQINTKTGEFKRTPMDKGMIIETLPDGTTRITEGAGVGSGTGEVEVGDVYNPAAAADAVVLINDILGADERGNVTPEGKAIIEGITGPLEGGGGNDIDAMSGGRRWWYGEKGLDKIEKLNQLQSKAWLAARDMLKGGGPITDYESRKAEAAVARLSRAKGPDEFIAALTELREAITAGEAKLKAARAQGAATTSPPATTTAPQGGNVTSSGVQWSIVE